MSQIAQFFPLQGGLNLATPAIRTPAGHLIGAENYEPVERGYRRIDGFERFDGRPKPSDASYWVIDFDQGTADIDAGQIVTGATSGATGEALVDMVIEEGQNLLLWSEQLDRSATWEAFGTVTVNQAQDADGNLTLERISEVAAASRHIVRQMVAKAASAIAYTLSAELKAGERTYAVLAMQDSNFGNRAEILVDLSAGTVGTPTAHGTFASASGTIESLGDGRYRATLTATSSTDTAIYAIVGASDGTAHSSAYAGDTTKGIFAGRVQLESASEAHDYSKTEATNITGNSGYLVLFNVSGTFQDNENLQVSAATKCVADGTATERGASNDTDDTTWLRAAIEATRTDIQTVTGSGRIRGGFVLGGTCYCIRDNAGATAGVLYKATTSGWTAQSLGSYLKYDAGTAEFTEGQTLTGGTSGATATIRRVANRTGTWGSNAAGLLILTGITGTFQNNETITDGAGGSATADGTVTANALPAGGRYEVVTHNFFGASDLTRAYGVNGVGTAFEWDGTYFVPIFTGMTTDTPTHVAVQKNQLFLSFPGGSSQNSGIGDPYSWSAVTGASEIGIGQDITGYVQDYAKSLLILGRNKVCELFGNDATDFVLETLAEDAGAIEWTMQKIGVPIYMDDRGLRDIRTTAAYGDFKMGTISQMVEPLFRAKKKAGVTPTASIRCRTKDQYRLFWSDGTGLAVYFGRKTPESIPFDLGLTVYAAWTGEDSSGNEIMFVGSDDGYVYQLDSGTSFDGDEVSAFLRLPFNHVGTPESNKRWHGASLEVDASPTVVLGMLAEFSYADPSQVPAEEQSFSIAAGGGFWDQDNFDEFYWSSPVEGIAECYLDGFGNNCSIAVISRATYEDAHTIHGLTLRYSMRGMKK